MFTLPILSTQGRAFSSHFHNTLIEDVPLRSPIKHKDIPLYIYINLSGNSIKCDTTHSLNFTSILSSSRREEKATKTFLLLLIEVTVLHHCRLPLEKMKPISAFDMVSMRLVGVLTFPIETISHMKENWTRNYHFHVAY